MSASAGRVLLIPRGTYDANVTYTPLDVVKYGVSSYVCKAETTGNVPTNTTYWQVLATGIDNVTPESIGIGYGISSDSGAARTATLADYVLTPNGLVSVSFASDVPANATLNINSQGAKPIYYRGSALVASVIRGGDTVTFAYDGTRYQVLCIDGGAGHKIVNSAGTELTQRDALQFTNGLEATDNAQGQKTEVGMYLPIVPRATWDAMNEQEQIAYKASHYRFGVEIPNTSGVINAEYMKLLWENPNTSQTFAAQTITLNSADYDFLLATYSYVYNPIQIKSVIAPKGANIYLDASDATGNGARGVYRIITPNSDTSLSISQSRVATGASASGYTNDYLIPIAIYGIKSSFQFKVNAIASELSTRADHCFLDDETTTVEDALENKISKGVVLWSQSASTFPASTFSLGDISKYKYFKIITSEGIGECLKANSLCISDLWYNNGIAGYGRSFSIESNGTVTVYDAFAVHNGNTNNQRIVPYKIIGYEDY